MRREVVGADEPSHNKNDDLSLSFSEHTLLRVYRVYVQRV